MSDHVEVLQRMKGWRMPPGESGAINSALDAAIAALAAPAGGDAVLAALHRFVMDAQPVDLGGGDAVVTTCESLELAKAALAASPTPQEARKLVTCKCHTERDRQLCRQRKECVVAYATGNQSTPQEVDRGMGNVDWREPVPQDAATQLQVALVAQPTPAGESGELPCGDAHDHMQALILLRDRIYFGGDISSELKKPGRVAAMDWAIARLASVGSEDGGKVPLTEWQQMESKLTTLAADNEALREDALRFRFWLSAIFNGEHDGMFDRLETSETSEQYVAAIDAARLARGDK